MIAASVYAHGLAQASLLRYEATQKKHAVRSATVTAEAPRKAREPAYEWLTKSLRTLDALPAMLAGAKHCVGEFLRDKPLPQSDAEAKADAAAMTLLERVVTDADIEKADVAAWATALAKRSAFTVNEHTAIAYILRSDFFTPSASADDASAHTALSTALARSWTNLTGGVPEDVYGRLPKLALRKASREARVYHAASFQPDLELRKPADLAARQAASSLLRDYVPENTDIVVAAAAGLATAFTTIGAPLIGMGVLSYCSLSLSESVFHSFAGHQKAKGLAQWIRGELPADAPFLKRKWHGFLHKLLADSLKRTHVSHGTVHHHLTFDKSFVEMFSSPEQHARVEAFIAKQPKDVADDIREELYGSTLTVKGCLRVLRAIAPQTAALVVAALAMGAPAWTALVPICMALGFPLSMARVHPHQHVDKEKALEDAGPLMKAILQTRWAAWSTRNHELHHHGECNFNLAFAGADALLGTLVQPNLRELFRMRAEGTLHY